jgi:hypothetical protein
MTFLLVPSAKMEFGDKLVQVRESLRVELARVHIYIFPVNLRHTLHQFTYIHRRCKSSADAQLKLRFAMGGTSPPFPTSLRLNPKAFVPSEKHIYLSNKYFTPAPILRFTVGKFSQLPDAEGPEVAVLGRSNVGVQNSSCDKF